MVGRILLFSLLLFGCALTPRLPLVRPLHNVEIVTDTLWSGEVVIDGQVKVFKGATLTIAPGTDITFLRQDQDQDGLGDGTLIIEGRLLALGRAGELIRFRSAAAAPRPGDWLEIRVDFSQETVLRYCEIRDSAHALHAHFTKATIEDSHIHDNIDGCRLGQGNFLFRHNLIEGNEGKGINFRNSTIEISDNIIRHNHAGIFLFETDRPPTILHNNIYANGENLRLGDFFHHDLEIGSNWWGSSDPREVAAAIYDLASDAALGRVSVGIAPAWLSGTGPRTLLALSPVRIVATDGFVDAPPLGVDEDLLIASWDGTVRRLDREGQEKWRSPGQEAIDAPLTLDGERLFGQNWGREVFALDATSGRRLWSFTYPPSPADDHRQGGLLRVESLLLVPAWNGTLYALAPESGRVLWSFSATAPLRARPLFAAGQIILSGGDGTLWSLGRDGGQRWQQHFPAPLLTPALDLGNGLLSLDRAGTVSALAYDGRLLWQRALGEACYYAAPLRSDDGLFVATAAGSLWKLDPLSGRVLWRRDGFGPIYSTPLVSGQSLIIGDNRGGLWVIDSISGNLLDHLDLGAPIQGGPTLFAGGIALGSRDQKVHLLRFRDQENLPADAAAP